MVPPLYHFEIVDKLGMMYSDAVRHPCTGINTLDDYAAATIVLASAAVERHFPDHIIPTDAAIAGIAQVLSNRLPGEHAHMMLRIAELMRDPGHRELMARQSKEALDAAYSGRREWNDYFHDNLK
jgi:hypothetical protein